MTRVIVDEALRNKLLDFAEPLDLCDESGRVLAQVFPAVDPSEYELVEPPISEEELRRLEDPNQRRYTTAEVLEHLERL
jgi:hypothetical protein